VDAERAVTRAWLLLVATSVAYLLGGNEADNDLWAHVLIGRRILDTGRVPRADDLSYTAAGAPWVDHEWLTHVAFGAVYAAAGDRGLWLLKLGAAVLTALALWRAVASRSTAPHVRGVTMVLVLAVMARGFAIRPQIVTYLAVAWLLLWLEPPAQDSPDTLRQAQGERRTEGRGTAHAEPVEAWGGAFVVALLFLFWANAHGGVVVGLAILGVFALAPPWRGMARRLAMLAVAVVTVCVNPYGPRLFAYLWHELRAPHPLTEWQPVNVTDPAHWPALALVALVAATLPWAQMQRRAPWRGVLLVAVTVMAARHQRHVPLVALCAAAPLAEQLDGALAWLGRRPAFRLSALATAIVAAGVALVAVAQLARLTAQLAADRFGVVYEAREYPVGAVRFIAAQGLRGHLALPLDWGSYALWHLAPEVKVSLDGRFATVYPPAVVRANFDLFFDGDTRLLRTHPTDLVLLPSHRALVRLPAGWRVAYQDAVATLYTRNADVPLTLAPARTGRLRFP
jgi:hypothetical protein